MTEIDADATAWLDAIATVSYKTARRHLRADQDVNVRGAEGKTALHIAAEMGNRQTVERLLNDGADATMTDDYGRTPLRTAQMYIHTNVAAYLLQSAELKRALGGRLGKTPTLGQLLNAMNQYKWKAFRLQVQALYRCDLPSVRSLLESGDAHVDLLDKKTGETPFSAALASGMLHVCEYLMDICDYALGTCIVDGVSQSTLVTAVRHGDVTFLRRFLAHRRHQSTPLSDPQTCVLTEAVKTQSGETVDTLIYAGVDFNSMIALNSFPPEVYPAIDNENFDGEDKKLWQRLCMACWQQDVRCVKRMFDTHSELQDRTTVATKAANALFLAAHRQNEEIVKELLARGAQINSIGARGVSAMVGAVHTNAIGMLQYLLDRADQCSAAQGIGYNKSLLVTAVFFGAMECAYLVLPMENHCENRAQAMVWAIHRGEEEFAALLLDQGTLPSNDAMFPYCVRQITSPAMLDLFLTRCCAKRFHISSLAYPFQYQCREKGKAALLSVLVAHGIDVNTHDGLNSPLTNAVSQGSAGDLDIVKLLVESGADLNGLLSALALVEQTLGSADIPPRMRVNFEACRQSLLGNR